jgi:hypothetical protein
MSERRPDIWAGAVWDRQHPALKALLFLIALALVSLVFACASADTPAKKLAVAQTTYAATVEGMTAVARTGLLDLPTLERLNGARMLARAAIDHAGALLKNGEPGALDYVLFAGRTAADFAANFAQAKADAEKRKGIRS